MRIYYQKLLILKINFEIKNLFVIYKLKIKSHRNDELQLFICNPKLKIPQES